MDKLTDLSYRMITDVCGLHFLDTEATYAFLIVTRKLYRNVAYHNFEHAFVFLHCIYCMLKRYGDRFDQLDKLSLMLGALVHDIDHPGYTNTFLKLSNHPLATLYEDSFLENHHFWLGQLVVKVSVFNYRKARTLRRIVPSFCEIWLLLECENVRNVTFTFKDMTWPNTFGHKDRTKGMLHVYLYIGTLLIGECARASRVPLLRRVLDHVHTS